MQKNTLTKYFLNSFLRKTLTNQNWGNCLRNNLGNLKNCYNNNSQICSYSTSQICSYNNSQKTPCNSSHNICNIFYTQINKNEGKIIFHTKKKYVTTQYWAENTKNKIHESKINEWRNQFKILSGYTDNDLMIWRDSFNKMDKDKDDFISHADLQKSDWSLEKYILFQNYDKDKNNLIDFGEYIQAVIDIDTQHFKNFFQGFSKIDIEMEFEKYAITGKENNKKIIPLLKLMQMIKDKEFTCVTETDSNKLFKEMDVNNDGLLDFEDFLAWIGKK